MRNILPSALTVVLLVIGLLSCRNPGVEGPTIDQVTRIYIDSAGIDLLDTQQPIHYAAILMNDEYAMKDSAPVAFTTGQEGGKHYLQYIAGATRKAVGNAAGDSQHYQSKIRLNIKKQLTGSKTVVFNDTLVINYLNSPEEFRLLDATYNSKKIFTKVAGQPNHLLVHK